MLQKLKQLVQTAWANDFVRRVVHTAWQAAAGVLLTGLVASHSSTDVKVVLVAAFAAALSAAKGAVAAKVQGE